MSGKKGMIRPKLLTLEERFWAKVNKTDSCWLWTGFQDSDGYGRFHLEGVRSGIAHRVSFELSHGPISEGLVIDHKCYNPACVNPEHLQAVTQKQNSENRSGLARNNTSGVRGVCWHGRRNKWLAYAGRGKDRVYVGYFTDLREAEAAVVAKRNELFTNNLRDRVV